MDVNIPQSFGEGLSANALPGNEGCRNDLVDICQVYRMQTGKLNASRVQSQVWLKGVLLEIVENFAKRPFSSRCFLKNFLACLRNPGDPADPAKVGRLSAAQLFKEIVALVVN